MYLIPKKDQWKRWSLPSKLTAIGAYLAIVPVALSVLSVAGNAAYDYVDNHYSVVEKQLSEEVFRKHTGKGLQDSGLHIEVSYPEITSIFDNPAFEQANTEIMESIISNLKPNLIDLLRKYSISLQNNRVLSITFESYSYYQGAFNGDGSYGSINIDLKNDTFIEFFDVFDVRKQPVKEVKVILKSHIEDGCIMKDKWNDDRYIPRFSLTDKGVLFLFSEYEATIGACGHSTVEVPYRELGMYIRKDGPIGHEFKASANWDGREHKKNSVGIYY